MMASRVNKQTTKQRKRKKRKGEYLCKAKCYKFPHRFGGGRCDGGAYVVEVFELQMFGDCKDCHFRETLEGVVVCQVLEGLEPISKCPQLQEFVRYEGIMMNLNK